MRLWHWWQHPGLGRPRLSPEGDQGRAAGCQEGAQPPEGLKRLSGPHLLCTLPSGHEAPRCCVPSSGVEGPQMELSLRAQGPSLVRLHGLMFPFHLGAWNGGPEPPQQGPHLPVRLFPTSLFCTEFGRQPGNFWKVYGPGQAVQTCLPPRAERVQVVPRQMQRQGGGGRVGGVGEGGTRGGRDNYRRLHTAAGAAARGGEGWGGAARGHRDLM